MKAARLAAASVLASLVFFLGAPAARGGKPSSDPVKESKEYFQRGIILFEAGDFKGALENFLTSYDLRPHFKIKYNLGVCYYALGQYAEAANEIEEFLLESGDDVEEKIMQKSEHILEDVRPKLGKIYFDGAKEGAVIMVDGKSAGVFPLEWPLYVLPGEHEIRSVAADGSKWSSKVTIVAGERKDIKIGLKKSAASEANAQGETDAGKEGEETGEDSASPEKPGSGKAAAGHQEPSAKKKIDKAYAYAAVALGGAAIVAAAVTGGLALKKSGELDDLDGECEAAGCTSSLDAHDAYTSKRDEVYDEARLTGNLCTGFIVAAGILSAATVLLFVFSGPWKAKEAKGKAGRGAAIFPLVSPGGQGAVLRFEF